MIVKPDWFDRWFSKVFEDKNVYTPAEVAEGIGRSIEFIYRALRAGELEGIKVGKRTYIIPKDALKQWLVEFIVLNVED